MHKTSHTTPTGLGLATARTRKTECGSCISAEGVTQEDIERRTCHEISREEQHIVLEVSLDACRIVFVAPSFVSQIRRLKEARRVLSEVEHRRQGLRVNLPWEGAHCLFAERCRAARQQATHSTTGAPNLGRQPLGGRVARAQSDEDEPRGWVCHKRENERRVTAQGFAARKGRSRRRRTAGRPQAAKWCGRGQPAGEARRGRTPGRGAPGPA